jgi:hypothetical protein
VGDSRAYVIRGHNITQATKDQSLVNQLIDAGYITEEQAQDHIYKNVILQALGAQPDTVVVLDRLTIYRGDVILLCSDGLSNKVQGTALADAVTSCADLDQACRNLIALANERGGEDNITVVLCQFSGEGLLDPPDNHTLYLERIERDESLPLHLLPGLLDADSLVSEDLEDLDRTLTDMGLIRSPLAASIDGDIHPVEQADVIPVRAISAEPTGVERNIVRILMGLMIVLIVGAIMAVTWYLRIWRDRNQNPREPVSPSMTMVPHPRRSPASLIPLCLVL